ncbi:MAG: VWA domain-containing protein, partial [Actinobacteria bacterium]|nr:VWA domain-containing protein [Actinomycetota bacterium]
MPTGSCLDARDCEPGQSCTMDGECTFQPTEDERCPDPMECREGEICSEEGWCIADGTCGTDGDCEDPEDQCSPGHVCLPDGACSTNSECPEGTECVDGDCLPGGDCGETEYGIDNPPNLLILLDRSGSMDEAIDGRSKWEIAVEAITSTIGAWDTSIRFGLALFSDCDNCEPGSIFVDCASDSADQVIATLGGEPRCPTTPIGASLNAMLGQATIQDDTRQNAILLVTDGQDTCDGDPSAEAAALLAQTISVPTYVVGFGSGVDAGELQATAQAGGTTDYYQADSADGLESALSAISG